MHGEDGVSQAGISNLSEIRSRMQQKMGPIGTPNLQEFMAE